jgi:hypothetical protein
MRPALRGGGVEPRTLYWERIVDIYRRDGKGDPAG